MEEVNNIFTKIYRCTAPFCCNYRDGSYSGRICYKNCSGEELLYTGYSSDIPSNFYDNYFIVASCLHEDGMRVPFEQELWVYPSDANSNEEEPTQ